MLMIVALHFLGKTGFWDVYPPSSLGYNLVWAAVTICNVGVNAFVLISGYFLATSKFKLSRLLALSIEVLFYSLFIYVGLVLTGHAQLQPYDLLVSFFPIILGKYWFITMYIGMYVLFPFLNKMLRGLNKYEHLLLIVLVGTCTSIWPIVAASGGTEVQSYALNYGFSATWFVVLYSIAAWLRFYYTPDYRPLKYFVRYLFATAISLIIVLGTVYLGRHGLTGFSSLRGILNGYNSITVLVPSVLFFIFMLNYKIPQGVWTKLIGFFAPLTLGVYLIHDEPHLAALIWAKLNPVSHAHQLTLILYALVCILGIYVMASLIEWVRQKAFAFLSTALFHDLNLIVSRYEVKVVKKQVHDNVKHSR